MDASWRPWVLFLVVVALPGCPSTEERGPVSVTVLGADGGSLFPDLAPAAADGPVVEAAPGGPVVSDCSPSHGPFVGGTRVTITGSGFSKKSVVRVGGRAIQVGKTTWYGPTKIVVVTPAGTPGAADVTVTDAGRTGTLASGFTYDPVYLDPASGPTVGGTLVEIFGSGTAFAKGSTVTLDGAAMTGVEVISATRMRAKTPPGAVGAAELAVTPASGTALRLKEAYAYYASTNPLSGGLGGGPVKGTITVSVLDATTRKPVPDAAVNIKGAGKSWYTGKTDLKGMVVLSDQNLLGPLDVTAGKDKYETTTVANLDARDVTIFLSPIVTPSPGPPPPAAKLGQVSGMVMFGGMTGVGDALWGLVPEPSSSDEIKRAFVHASVLSLAHKVPAVQTSAVIDHTPGSKVKAWPYALKVVPAMQAVYCLAGLYTKSTGAFVPHALGVTRGVVVGPGESRANVDVLVDIPLRQTVTLKLKDVPASAAQHDVRLAIDLGAEGYIVRLDTDVQATGVVTSFAFARQPILGQGGLRDASFAVKVALDAGGTFDKPYVPFVRGTMRSVKPNQAGVIEMGAFVGPVTFVSPTTYGTLQNNALSWTPSGAAASLAVTVVVDLSLNPVWRVITGGTTTGVQLPDPTTLGLTALPKGSYLVWAQWEAHLPSYDFNKFNYNHLSSDYWDRWSQSQSYFQP